MNFRRKTYKGLFWSTLTSLVTRSLRFLTTLILAKILLPSDFGLFAIGLIVINFVIVFRDLGLGQALIQHQKDIEEASYTAFIMNQICAILLMAITFAIAPLIAKFFKNEAVLPILRTLSLILPIDALATVPSYLLEKKLSFAKKFIPETTSILGFCITGISLAFLKFGVWSIVFAQIVSSIIFTTTILKIYNWKFRLRFNSSLALKLFSFGKYIMGMNLISFLVLNIDSTFIGRLTNTTQLGLYSFALMLANLPVVNISHIVSKVTFPLYSQMQNKKELLLKTYMNTLKYVSIVAIPASLFIFFFCPEFIIIFYAHKWSPAILPLQILVFYGLLRALFIPSTNLLLAIGQAKYLFIIAITELILSCSLLYTVTSKFGITGTALLMTSVMAFGCLLTIWPMIKIIKIPIKQYLAIFVRYSIYTLFAITIVNFTLKPIFSKVAIFSFALRIVLSFAIYLLIILRSEPQLKRFFMKFLQKPSI